MSAIRYRPPTPADAPAVFELLGARDRADYGVPDITLADLRDDWSRADLAADALVAQEAGAIVGYAILNRPGAMGFVAPEHEGRGIGTRLLAWAENRERAQGRAQHRQAAAAGNARARALFLAHGYRYERSYARMVRVLDGTETPAQLDAMTVRTLAPEHDARELHALDELSFAGNADYSPEPLAAFVDEHLAPHDLAPELSLVACDGDTAVAFVLARRWREEATGFIDLLAVHPDWRRRGLGSALLRTAFAAFAADGLREAQLGVASDNPRALRIYESAGMRPRFVVDAFVRAPADPAHPGRTEPHLDSRARPQRREPMNDFNAQIIDEFRANDGKVGGMFEGATLLLLHHTGAKSGADRVTPLVYLDDGDRYVIFASKAGAPENPAWYHNLKAHPATEIEVATKTVAVQAVEVTGEERERLFSAQAARSPQFAEYQKKTERAIPVIALQPR